MCVWVCVCVHKVVYVCVGGCVYVWVWRSSFTFSTHHLQTSPTDLRHFDPMLTALPPTITDLVSTDRALYLEGFDFVAANNFDYAEEKENIPSEAPPDSIPNKAPPDRDGDVPSNQVKVEVEVHPSEESGTMFTGD